MKSQNYYEVFYRKPGEDDYFCNGFTTRKEAVDFSAQLFVNRFTLLYVKVNGKPVPPEEFNNLIIAANLHGVEEYQPPKPETLTTVTV